MSSWRQLQIWKANKQKQDFGRKILLLSCCFFQALLFLVPISFRSLQVTPSLIFLIVQSKSGFTSPEEITVECGAITRATLYNKPSKITDDLRSLSQAIWQNFFKRSSYQRSVFGFCFQNLPKRDLESAE